MLTTRKRNATSNTAPNATTKDEDPASHENEGFLKSVWHKMTHHPAHEKPGEAGSKSTDESSTKKSDEGEQKKKTSDSA